MKNGELVESGTHQSLVDLQVFQTLQHSSTSVYEYDITNTEMASERELLVGKVEEA